MAKLKLQQKNNKKEKRGRPKKTPPQVPNKETAIIEEKPKTPAKDRLNRTVKRIRVKTKNELIPPRPDERQARFDSLKAQHLQTFKTATMHENNTKGYLPIGPYTRHHFPLLKLGKGDREFFVRTDAYTILRSIINEDEKDVYQELLFYPTESHIKSLREEIVLKNESLYTKLYKQLLNDGKGSTYVYHVHRPKLKTKEETKTIRKLPLKQKSSRPVLKTIKQRPQLKVRA